LTKRKQKRQPATRVGIAWYRPDQWEHLRQVSADGDAIERTFAELEDAATARLRDLKSEGVDVTKVMVDVDELVQWCSENRLRVDAQARAQFVAEELRTSNLHTNPGPVS